MKQKISLFTTASEYEKLPYYSFNAISLKTIHSYSETPNMNSLTAAAVNETPEAASGPKENPYRSILNAQRKAFMANGVLSFEQRIAHLDTLKRAIGEFKDPLIEAVMSDFGHRNEVETIATEVIAPAGEIGFTKSKLKGWMKHRRVRPTLQTLGGTGKILYQPKGVIGVMGAWNYPASLSLSPLIGAMAAGNHCMVRPSDLSPATTEVMKQMLAKHFEDNYITVIDGDVNASIAFSELPFDHLVYTGGTQVGSMVMQAAAKNLTPVTLEMGGKSPVIIADDADMNRAIESILMGKLINSGQTCIAPDYILIPEQMKERFIELCSENIAQRYPSLAQNDDITWIINERHFQRIQGLIDDAKEKGARVIQVNPASETIPEGKRIIPPTLITDVNDDMEVMREEIFGPLLPVLGYQKMDDAIQYINDRPRPLALYYFGKNNQRAIDTVYSTTSGGACVNETMLHVSHNNMPFGGIGPSGLGGYHGFDGFVEFSHKKSVYYQGPISPAKWIKPPYAPKAKSVMTWVANKVTG
ncbi:MAG: coniferyl aldehyde dehydrogenase [Pseudomonadales bacterium]|nr:coniferyl aldehyde dehydrogenase [Pseudomonadales bacterium]